VRLWWLFLRKRYAGLIRWDRERRVVGGEMWWEDRAMESIVYDVNDGWILSISRYFSSLRLEVRSIHYRCI